MSGKQAYSYGQILAILALIAAPDCCVLRLSVSTYSTFIGAKNRLQSGTEAAAQAGPETQPPVGSAAGGSAAPAPADAGANHALLTQ